MPRAVCQLVTTMARCVGRGYSKFKDDRQDASAGQKWASQRVLALIPAEPLPASPLALPASPLSSSTHESTRANVQTGRLLWLPLIGGVGLPSDDGRGRLSSIARQPPCACTALHG